MSPAAVSVAGPWLPVRLVLLLALSPCLSSAFSPISAAFTPSPARIGASPDIRDEDCVSSTALRHRSATQMRAGKASVTTKHQLAVSEPSTSFKTTTQLVVAEDESQAVGIISHHEAVELLELKEYYQIDQQGRRHHVVHHGVSLDLGYSETSVIVTREGVSLTGAGSGNKRVVLIATWDELDEIVRASHAGQVGCYALYADGTKPWKVTSISLKTGRAAVLHPPKGIRGPPTVFLGSFPMHRITESLYATIGPAEDTRRKLDALKMKKVYGKVLDTATGLGYTAIAAARCAHVTEVVTIELDHAPLELCRYNPWSQELFASNKIRMMQGDACELVKTFGDHSFSAVIHDPPNLTLCSKSSNLYASSFYAELYRVLRWRGRLFHFIGGNPKHKSARCTYKAVLQRLESVGFKKVMIVASAHGVVAEKGEDRKSKKALHQAMRRSDLKRRSSKRRKHVHMSWAPSDFEWPMGLPMDLPGLDGGEEGGDVWNIGQAN